MIRIVGTRRDRRHRRGWRRRAGPAAGHDVERRRTGRGRDARDRRRRDRRHLAQPANVGGTVVDAPYSAEAVTEVTQMLADGNRIEQRTSATIARDSQGRMRREQHGVALGSFVAAGDQPIVTITDPSTGVHLTLNYEQKVAYRSKPVMRYFAAGPGGEKFEAGRATVMSSRGATVEAAGSAAGEPSWTIAAPPVDQLIVDGRPFELAVPPPPPPPPPPGMTAAARFDGQVSTETLAPREIEGIRAEGTRTTMTIPAGAMGNVLPIEVVSERWYSPELQCGADDQTQRSALRRNGLPPDQHRSVGAGCRPVSRPIRLQGRGHAAGREGAAQARGTVARGEFTNSLQTKRRLRAITTRLPVCRRPV